MIRHLISVSSGLLLHGLLLPGLLLAQTPTESPPPTEGRAPSRSETIQPIRSESFDHGGKARERRQGGNPRQVAGYLVFDGSTDGNRQVDPQIAVGGGYVFHGTNSGLVIYDKAGNFVDGVSQSAFNGGIDPKLFFDPHNRVFGFDLWNPWDDAKLKPVNVSVSAGDDPTKAWNTYPVPAPGGVDGGGIGYSRKWIGYSFPGGDDRTFVLRTAQAKAGEPAEVFHFAGSLGHPVQTQDPVDDLYFVDVGRRDIRVVKVTEGEDGTPRAVEVGSRRHGFEFNGYPPQSPQKGTDQKTASGDRNPKNLVLQGGFLWFSHAVHCKGRAAVQWHQLELDGTVVQSGLIHDPATNYIQTTLAVNRNLDVLVGFQETNGEMFISPRLAFRRASDTPGTLREIVRLGEGQAATDGVAWGDYSGSVVDGDNLLDLWTIQSIAGADGRGDTVICRVPFEPSDDSEPGRGETAEWQPLFNGTDLSGWRTTGNWIVQDDGVVTLEPRPGESGWQRYDAYLTSERTYSDFVLDLEFKFEPKGNSGVFLRVGDRSNHVDSGLEVQILDTYGKEDVGHHDCGGVIRTVGPTKNMVKPAGEWNRYTITMRGSQLTVVLNGEQIVDIDLSDGPMKDRPAAGWIGFQDEAKRIWYRNVRIKEL